MVDEKHLAKLHLQKELKRRYLAGERDFPDIELKDFYLSELFLVDINLSSANLEDARFGFRFVRCGLNVQLVPNIGVFQFIQTSHYCRSCASAKPQQSAVKN